jgi:hypothetical protein
LFHAMINTAMAMSLPFISLRFMKTADAPNSRTMKT